MHALAGCEYNADGMDGELLQEKLKYIEAVVSPRELLIDDAGAEVCPEWIANMLKRPVFLVPRIEVLGGGNQLYEALAEYMYHHAVDIIESIPAPEPKSPKPNGSVKPPPPVIEEAEISSEDIFSGGVHALPPSDSDSSGVDEEIPSRKPNPSKPNGSIKIPPPPKEEEEITGEDIFSERVGAFPSSDNDSSGTDEDIPVEKAKPPKPNGFIKPPPPPKNEGQIISYGIYSGRIGAAFSSDGDTSCEKEAPIKPNGCNGIPYPPPINEDQRRENKKVLLREFRRKCALNDRKYPGVLSTLSASVEYRPVNPVKKNGKADPTKPVFSFGLGYAKTMYKNALIIARHVQRSDLGKLRSLILYSSSVASLKQFCNHAKQWHFERHRSEKCAPPPKPRTYSLFLLNVRESGDSMWKLVGQKDSRSLKSIVLREGQLKTIVADFRDFQSNTTRKWYIDRGLPHRRCYLFYGSPGTGKTSTIRALAGELGLKACFLSLSDNHFQNKTLQQAVMRMPKPGMLVIEDIDVLFNDRRKSETLSLVTFSGLLNVLDGLVSADGILTVMTTNHPERLDPALTRAGRVDRRFEFKSPDRIQMRNYFLSFYPDADLALARKFSDIVFARPETEARSIATVQEHFIYTREKSAEESVAAVNEFFDEYYGHSFRSSALSYTT